MRKQYGYRHVVNVTTHESEEIDTPDEDESMSSCRKQVCMCVIPSEGNAVGKCHLVIDHSISISRNKSN